MDKELEQWVNREIPNESMKICNDILPVDEQDRIVDKALEDHHEKKDKT